MKRQAVIVITALLEELQLLKNEKDEAQKRKNEYREAYEKQKSENEKLKATQVGGLPYMADRAVQAPGRAVQGLFDATGNLVQRAL